MSEPINVVELVSQPPSSGISVKPFSWQYGTEGYNVELDYLLEGILPAKSFGVVYGPSGSYKSFLVMSWCAHISSGMDWDGKKTKRSGVLYVVAEGGIGAPRRVKAFEKAYLNGRKLDNFFVVNEPVHISSIHSEQMLEATIEDIEKKCSTKIELVVFDTLARCFNGADENSTKDMNYFVAGCDTLKANKGVTVLVVHHSGKNEANAARGSSALRAACDFEYKVTRPDSSSEGEPTLILKCEKMKDDEPLPERAYSLKPQHVFTQESGKSVYSLVVVPEQFAPPPNVDTSSEIKSKTQTAIWQSIRSRQCKSECTTKDLIRDDLKVMGMKVSNFSRDLQLLVENEHIREVDGQYVCVSHR
ncbi:helicase RepA family protein [Vibrio sinaloensis]|uniref:helicase RepA family protein n=1 Tax=Photobacterium sp. (strain ATCC 43367) TaxID=379097 RepID=UPI00204BF665|nr:helicase RepA family protein [Vibrio sinaloensis]UPQ87361.1 helicase RepA family protein [Vibrio sinaloensis]